MTTETKSKRKQAKDRREEAQKDRVLPLVEDDAGNVSGNVIIGAAVSLMVLFILGGIIQKEAASQKADCATIHAGDTVAIADCKDQVDLNLTIWGIAAIVLLLGAAGLYKLKRTRG